MLSDGTLCQKCDMTIRQLLSEKKWWVDNEEYREVVGENFSARKNHVLPLEKAKALLSLRDTVSGRFFKTVELADGSVFVTQSVFSMPPSPGIFILRAMKLKNKAVLQGFVLRGEVKKGDTIRINFNGTVRSFTALDVVPAGTNPLKKETFFDQLSANVHKHKLSTDGEGWIILDTEDYQSIPQGAFAAAFQ